MKQAEHRKQGNTDEREKQRRLSADEQRRLAHFEAQAEALARQGYRRVELTVGIVKANVFAVVLLIPLLIIGVGLFLLRNGLPSAAITPSHPLLVLAVLLLLIVVHELIHGLSWAIFAEHHFRDIAFGVIWQYLTPYCSCMTPLSLGQYVFGGLMPLLLLGLVPMLVGILLGSLPLLLIGILMADAAAGDILIVWKLLHYQGESRDLVYMDHPTQAGGVVFER